MTTIADQFPRPLTLEPEQFSGHQGKVIDLTGKPYRFIPAWLSKLPGVERIIVSNNPYGQNINFESGFSEKVIVEARGNNLEHPPENLNPHQVQCETDFTSREYQAQFTQPEEEFVF